MADEIAYMLGVVAVGFAVNYALRALPFLLFAGRDRALPDWVRRFGNVISPVIIGALIVYSYSGLEWKTAWPYLAGMLTVGLQLWKRNALVSILAGTVLYMFLVAGCASARPIRLDADETSIRYTNGGVYLADERVDPAELAERLDGCDVPRTRTIHIRLDPEVRDLRGARLLMNHLARGGYTRSLLVTERHAEAATTGRRPAARSGARTGSAAKPKRIRFKGADE